MGDTRPIEPAEPRHVRYNYAVHAVEGGLFMGGLAFVSFTTLMPTVVKHLGGPDWLVSLTPIMMWSGLMLPPVFTAHRIDRLRRYMPLLLVTGIIQRLPYLAAALALFYLADARPLLVLAVVAFGPLVAGVASGVSLTAWQQLLLRTVPQRRRSSLMASRYVIASLLGLGAGWAAKAVLASHPGTQGYAILHLCAFGMLIAGYLAFALIRETPSEPPPGPAVGLAQNLRAIPQLLRQERRVRQYMVARSLMSGVFILTPFLAIYARHRLGETESYLGQLLMVQMVGAIVGNVVGGALGDRAGGKAVLILSQVAFIVLAAWSAVAGTDVEFQVIFALFGLAFSAMNIGTMTLSLEVCPLRQRSTYLAVISFTCLVSMVAATVTSALVWSGPDRFAALAVLTVVSVGASLAFLVPLRDPRSTSAAG
ncbi:MAG TPA: MFS transporter [Phycisphaerae bacterium]|nr:MFS transporter [Phycisphaerae bacterium]